jgi:UDP-N-acetylglucosamine 1-carboxyvinyltransferase
MAASLLTDEKFVLSNVPNLMDIRTMARLLAHLGVSVGFLLGRMSLHAKKIRHHEAPYDLVRTMRASILVLGPLLSRTGKARVSLPGGCAIGARPVNLHIKALEEMGAKIKLEGGYIDATCSRLKGAKIIFDKVTVTGTENIMMAAALAKGQTVIENAACEPEVVDLAIALNQMGANVHGAGTPVITIDGVDRLCGAEHRVIPDRVEAGTFMIAAALTRGHVFLDNMDFLHVEALSRKLLEAGAQVIDHGNRLEVLGPKEIKPVNIITDPYPGFATDFQAQFTALMAVAHGACTITETIFENRFMHIQELMRMGADLRVEGNTVFVRGVERLQSAPVMATDLRASASLVLAGLVAKGVTDIHRVYHIDRGYDNIEKKLRKLGARVKRAKVRY